MTNDTITIEQITATKTYGSLNTIQQSFCIKRKNRQSLTDALIVFRNTNVIPGCVFGYNLGILGDLIKFEQPKTA